MIICSICAREHDGASRLPPYLKGAAFPAKPEWASQVCIWCWRDFTRKSGYLTEDDLAYFVATELAMLAKRAARGASLIRCDAICWSTNANGGVPSHRCNHFVNNLAASADANLCGIHLDAKRRGRRVDTNPPTAPRYVIAARSASEFMDEARKVLPADWSDALFGKVAP